MSNIQVVQAGFIQRKAQREYEQSGRDWLELIEEEVKKIKDEVGTRRLKRSEIIARNRIAVNYIRKNKHLSREELINYLVVELKFVRGTALRLTRENGKLRETKPNPFGTGKGLRAYLDSLEAEEQKAYERKMLEEELDRPKFFF